MPADLRDAMRLLEIVAELRSLADQPEPPGVMTVAMALRDPRVRSGSMWAEYMGPFQRWQLRVIRLDGGVLDVLSRAEGSHYKGGKSIPGWCPWGVEIISIGLLDTECTLISSQEGAR